jgi:hypothetical protein
MPMSARDYLNLADADRAAAVHEPAEHESFYLGVAQLSALQAVAAALDRLAQAVENLAGPAQGKT